MPFAGYKDFADCVSQNQDKDDPDAYCGSIKANVEKSDDSGRRFIEGWATVDVTDKQGDEILISGIVESLNKHFLKHSPIIHLEHQSVPVGDMLEVSVRKHETTGTDGIWIKAEIYSDYSLHNDVWQAILDKKLAAFSIKGKPLDAKKKCEGGQCWRVIPRFELVEVSIVGDPANVESVIEEVNWDAKKDSDCSYITDVFKDMIQKSGYVLPTNVFSEGTTSEVNVEELTKAVMENWAEKAGDNSPSAGVGYRKRREGEPGVYGGGDDNLEKDIESGWKGPFKGPRGGNYMTNPKGEHEYNPEKWPGQEHGEQAWDRRQGLPATGQPMDPETGKVRAPEYQDWETPKVQLSPWNKAEIQYRLRRGAQGAKDDVAEYEKMVEGAGDEKEKDFIIAVGKKMSELARDASNEVDGWARTELQEVSAVYSKFATGGKPQFSQEKEPEFEHSRWETQDLPALPEDDTEDAHRQYREGKLGKPYEAREEEVDIGTPQTRDHNTAIRAVETIWGKHGSLPGGTFQDIEARIRDGAYEEARAKLQAYIKDVHASQIPGDPDKTNAQNMEYQRDLGRLGKVLWNLTSTIPQEEARRTEQGGAAKSYYRKSMVEKQGWTGPNRGARGGYYMTRPDGKKEYDSSKWPGGKTKWPGGTSRDALRQQAEREATAAKPQPIPEGIPASQTASELDAEWDEGKRYYDRETGEAGAVWHSKQDPSLTIEVHPILWEGDPDDPEDEQRVQWMVFPARDGKGIPNSPDIADTEEEAFDLAQQMRLGEKSAHTCESCSMVDTIMEDKGSYGASEGQTSLNANVSPQVAQAKVKGDDDEEDEDEPRVVPERS